MLGEISQRASLLPLPCLYLSLAPRWAAPMENTAICWTLSLSYWIGRKKKTLAHVVLCPKSLHGLSVTKALMIAHCISLNIRPSFSFLFFFFFFLFPTEKTWPLWTFESPLHCLQSAKPNRQCFQVIFVRTVNARLLVVVRFGKFHKSWMFLTLGL